MADGRQDRTHAIFGVMCMRVQNALPNALTGKAV